MVNTEKLAQLLTQQEGKTLDFKEKQYRLDNDHFKAEFLKDIISMANTERNEAAYIVLGVAAHADGTKTLFGLSDHQHIDDKFYQDQLYNAKASIHPKPDIHYSAISYDGKIFGVIEIAISTNGPFIPEKAYDNNTLEANAVYHRKGSVNTKADAIERKNIYNWFNQVHLYKSQNPSTLSSNQQVDPLIPIIKVFLSQSSRYDRHTQLDQTITPQSNNDDNLELDKCFIDVSLKLHAEATLLQALVIYKNLISNYDEILANQTLEPLLAQPIQTFVTSSSLQKLPAELQEIYNKSQNGSISALHFLLSEIETSAYRNSRQVVLVGGPGQGKSTIGQFIAQLHRYLWLNKLDEITLETQQILSEANVSLQQLPKRVVFRVLLKEFATWRAATIATQPQNFVGLWEFLAFKANQITSRLDITTTHIQEIFTRFPCLLILDGLDEVVEPSIRSMTLKLVQDFITVCNDLGADLYVLGTTRSTSYSQRFSPAGYLHFDLQQLDANQVAQFAIRWVNAQNLSGEEKNRILTTLERSQKDNIYLQQLLKTPLQVAIVLLIIQAGGDLPSRYISLFEEYWRVILNRERNKGEKFILSDDKKLFDLHCYLALELHNRATNANGSVAALTLSEFRSFVFNFLQNRYKDTEPKNQERLNQEVEEVIREASDRLVLIVGLENDLFGFEIRSIQEFFAAMCIFQADPDGSTNLKIASVNRFARLRQLVLSDHWRNVLSFVVEKMLLEVPNEVASIRTWIYRYFDVRGNDTDARKGAWAALEIAAFGVLRNNYDEQTDLIEYGLKVFDIPISKEQQGTLFSLLSNIRNLKTDKNVIKNGEVVYNNNLLDAIEAKINELVGRQFWSGVKSALMAYSSLWGASDFYSSKVEVLLAQSQEMVKDVGWDLALTYSTMEDWLAPQLENYWPEWLHYLPYWWQTNSDITYDVLDEWSPTEEQLKQLVAYLWIDGRVVPENSSMANIEDYFREPRLTPIKQLQLFVKLFELLEEPVERNGLGIYHDRIELPHGWETGQELVNVGNAEWDRLLLRPQQTLLPQTRFALWVVYWFDNPPNEINLASYFADLRQIKQELEIPNNFWKCINKWSWRLLNVVTRNELLCGDINVSKILPELIEAKQIETAVKIKEAITNRLVEYGNLPPEQKEASLLRLNIALRVGLGLSELLPELIPLAEKLESSVDILVYHYIYYYEVDEYQPEWPHKITAKEYPPQYFQEFFEGATKLIDNCVGNLTTPVFNICQYSWPNTTDVRDSALAFFHSLLNKVNTITGPITRSNFVPAIFDLFIKLTYLCDETFPLIEQVGPAFLGFINQVELDLDSLLLQALAEIPHRYFTQLKKLIMSEDPEIKFGAAKLWRVLVESVRYYGHLSINMPKGSLEEIDLGLALLQEDGSSETNKKLRCTGVALLVNTNYPIEKREYRNALIRALKQSGDIGYSTEDSIWEYFFNTTEITNENQSAWKSALEEIMYKPEDYGIEAPRAAMKRYLGIVETPVGKVDL